MARATKARKPRKVKSAQKPLAPNRKTRRAAAANKRPAYLIELPQGKDDIKITWINGADPWAAPAHLRRAQKVMEEHLGLSEPGKEPQ